MARRFRQADIARDYTLEHEIAETIANIVGNLVGQAIASIKHRQDDTDDAQRGIETLLNPLDRLEELAEPLQGEELALQGYEQGIGSTQGVECQKP